MFRNLLLLVPWLLPSVVVAQAVQPVSANPQLKRTPEIASQPDQLVQTVPFLDLNAEEVSIPESTGEGIDTDLLINFGLWMVVILCLCGLTAVGLRMLNRKGLVAAGPGVPSGARVVESLSLGRHRSVQLVEIGGRSVIVASDSSGIRSVVPLTEDFSETLHEASTQFEESGA